LKVNPGGAAAIRERPPLLCPVCRTAMVIVKTRLSPLSSGGPPLRLVTREAK
jgi:hypothetical protein